MHRSTPADDASGARGRQRHPQQGRRSARLLGLQGRVRALHRALPRARACTGSRADVPGSDADLLCERSLLPVVTSPVVTSLDGAYCAAPSAAPADSVSPKASGAGRAPRSKATALGLAKPRRVLQQRGTAMSALAPRQSRRHLQAPRERARLLGRRRRRRPLRLRLRGCGARLRARRRGRVSEGSVP